ncbi:MAG: fusion protein [Desulfovibrio sp.]|nr:fusion protein [Desulfovibrio sp.]
MRFASYDFYGPEESVLGHYIIFYGRVYIVTREEVRNGIPMLYMVCKNYDDGMVKGLWEQRNHIANPQETIIHWHPNKEWVLSRAACGDLFARAQDAERVRELYAREANRRLREDQVLFEQFLREKAPTDAKAILVAELREDESDSMTDYFASRVVRTVFLGFSKSARNNFSEMRKLASWYAPTKHLSGPKGVEHRENYTGGKGVFLGGPSSHSGWTVRKYVLPRTPHKRVDCWPWLDRQGTV